jgi:hypothetical protein
MGVPLNEGRDRLLALCQELSNDDTERRAMLLLAATTIAPDRAASDRAASDRAAFLSSAAGMFDMVHAGPGRATT